MRSNGAQILYGVRLRARARWTATSVAKTKKAVKQFQTDFGLTS